MANQVYHQIKSAMRNLNPEQVRETAERPLRIGLVAASSTAAAVLEEALLPAAVSRARRREIAPMLERASDGHAPERFDLVLYEEELLRPPEGFYFYPEDPKRTVEQILAARPELALPLARNFPPFRKPVIERIVRRVARENATFALATALPDVLPSLAELPWAFGEFASDTAFLTVNQVRMTFLIAAASNRGVGYGRQRPEIAGIVTGAFGWRALARELVGKIPFGGGLIPKAAIAYAGTYMVGLGLERLYRIGYGLSRAERRQAYREGMERGRLVARAILREREG